ncbi:MAG: helix-turn-helix domain-containing protein [Candidatus Altiarchaeales archaeon]|nr:helix-turn-helix domain-containing protein [Candidatus Altiarchaeales archaeon]MBD3415611.1 helix-turn-helix domain-containing protein [Candidatus Altiarchaeales archaeon]
MLTAKESVAKNIAGDITLADKSSDSMRKWREIFGLKQGELASRLKLSPSVISDYESGRRNSPGTGFVKRFVETLITVDEERGGKTISKFIVSPVTDAIIELRELPKPVKASRLVKAVEGEVVANKRLLSNRDLRGYTIIDSIQAIMNMSEREFRSIYGSSTDRALIFTKVKMGRSPMIAVKVTQPKPEMIVLHGPTPDKVDSLAKHIAESERIPLVVSKIKSEDTLIDRLGRMLT